MLLHCKPFLLFLDKSRNKWDKRRDHDDDDDHHDSKRNRGKEAAHERDWEVKRGKARESIRKDEQKGEWIFDRLVFNDTISFVKILESQGLFLKQNNSKKSFL